jgi:hypothetical protein
MQLSGQYLWDHIVQRKIGMLYGSHSHSDGDAVEMREVHFVRQNSVQRATVNLYAAASEIIEAAGVQFKCL